MNEKKSWNLAKSQRLAMKEHKKENICVYKYIYTFICIYTCNKYKAKIMTQNICVYYNISAYVYVQIICICDNG